MKITKTKKIGPSVVLLICLSLTGLVWLLLNNFNRVLAQQRFQDRTDQITTAITKRMEDYATGIKGGAAFFTAAGEVTRTEWRTYVEHLDISDTFPGIQGIGFSRVIQPSELAQHIQEIRAEGFPDYTVRPEGERGVYTSIIFLEPFDARNQRAFGFDMFSEPVRRTAMEKARDTDAPSISGKVKLVQETEQDVQSGFLMYVPVYLHGMPTDSVEDRRAAHQGYVYASFRIKDLIQGIFQEPLDDIDFEVFDGVEVSLETLMYDSDESGRGLDEEYNPMFSNYQTIDLYGHQWTLYFATRPPFEAISARFESWSVLIAGMIISLLAFFYTKGQETTRERAFAMAHDMTSELRKREDELKDSEAMWHGLVNANPESVYLTNSAGVILAANEVFAQRLGRDHQELIGANLFDLLPPEVTIERKKCMDKVNVSGQPIRFEDNRTGRFIDNYIHPIFNSDGKLTQLAFLCIDITEHRKTLEEIKEYAEQYQAMLSTSLFGYWLVDEKGRLLDVNDAYCKLSGYTRDELLKLSISDLETIEKPEDTARHIRKIIETGKDRFESKHKAKDGRVFDVEISTSFLPSRQEFIVFISDITDRKQAEMALRESETKYRIVADNTYDWEFWLDPEEQFIYTSPSCERITGLAADAFIAEASLLRRIIHPDDLPSYDRHRQEVIAPPAPGKAEFRIRRPDGAWLWIEHSCQPVFGDDGCFMGTRGSNRDITKRKLVAEEIHHRTEDLSALLNASRKLAKTLDMGSVLQATTDSISQMTGFQSAAIYLLEEETLYLGATWPELPPQFPEELRHAPLADHPHIRQAITNAIPIFLPDTASADLSPAERADSETRGLRSILYLPLIAGTQMVGALIVASVGEPKVISEDKVDTCQTMANLAALTITNARLFKTVQSHALELEQHVIERTVELSKFFRAVEQSPVSIVITDTAGNIEYVNPKFTTVTGYTFDEAIGNNPRIMKSGDMPDKEYEQMWKAITTGHEWHGEFHNKRKNNEFYWESASISPISNADGIVTHFIAIKEDITERKRIEAEILKLNAELEQHTILLAAARDEAEKANRAKSEFLSRMSHELRTPLNSILGFSQLMEMDKLNADHAQYVDQILKSGRHLLVLINEVLDISRIEAGHMQLTPEPVQLEESLGSAVSLIRPLAEQRGISLEVKLPSSKDLFVTADPQRLKQVLLNLLSNAVKYNREGGKIFVTASLQMDGFLHLAVHDTGEGIPAEKMSRLFTPFDRLEYNPDQVEGTGLGLALSKGLVEAMGGRIGADSVAGEGSTFWLILPQAENPHGNG